MASNLLAMASIIDDDSCLMLFFSLDALGAQAFPFAARFRTVARSQRRGLSPVGRAFIKLTKNFSEFFTGSKLMKD